MQQPWHPGLVLLPRSGHEKACLLVRRGSMSTRDEGQELGAEQASGGRETLVS